MPVCSPCRASLITGQRPGTHGIFLNDAHLADDAVTLAKVMKAAGYETGMIGKWHLNGRGRLSFIPPENRQGFDYWKVMECTHDYNESFYYADRRRSCSGRGMTRSRRRRTRSSTSERARQGGEAVSAVSLVGSAAQSVRVGAEAVQGDVRAGEDSVAGERAGDLRGGARKDLAGYYAHCSALDECIGDLRETLHDGGG